MIDLIVFSVGNNRYALNIENIQRIIQATGLTDIPNAHPLIDGMMHHEDKVIKVLSFRKLIGIESYDTELKVLFDKLKNAHEDWIEELKNSVNNGSTFTKTTDPHKCELGIWLDNFNSYDDNVSQTLKHLIDNHKYLHISGGDVLDLNENDNEEAKNKIETEIYDAFNKTMGDLDRFVASLDVIANSLQKLILYENNAEIFVIKVDNIEDIAHVEESDIMNSENNHTSGEFLELDGILDLNGVLINVIKTVKLPK